MKLIALKPDILRKAVYVILFCVILYSQIIISHAYTGQDYDPNKGTTCQVSLPKFDGGAEYCSNGPDSRGPCVRADVYSIIEAGSTNNAWGDGRDITITYSGVAYLYINGQRISEGPYPTSRFDLAVNGGTGSSGRDWVAPTLDPSRHIRFSRPSVYGDCYMRNGYPRVTANASGSSGSCTATIYLMYNSYYGPGDNTISPTGVTDSRSVTIQAVDRVVSYDYEYSISGRSGSGYGSSFSDTPSMVDAGGYCYVTFYTESGLSNSKEIPIPDIATLTYNANGGTGTPSSQTVWEGQSVTVSTLKPTRNNYEFLGWNRSSAYNDLPYGAGVPSGTLTGGSSITLNSDTTLYAVWRTVKVPYNIAFTLNGKPATNDFVNITGTVVDKNGTRRDITDSRAFSALEIPGYTVSASVKSTDDNVFIINGNDNRSTDYVYSIPIKTITTATTDTINCGTIHTVMYDANGGNYGKDAAGND